jgi:hypothetical protein
VNVEVEHGARRAKIEISMSAKAKRRQEFSSTVLKVNCSDYSGDVQNNIGDFEILILNEFSEYGWVATILILSIGFSSNDPYSTG